MATESLIAHLAPHPEAYDKLYKQLALRIGELIEHGTLRPGERIPSVRQLSRQEDLSIATVTQAYRVLENRGLIESPPAVRLLRSPASLVATARTREVATRGARHACQRERSRDGSPTNQPRPEPDRTEAIAKYFPAGTKVTRPTGGYVLWVELPPWVDSLELFQRALAERIGIAPGPIFSPKQKYRNCIRLSCGSPWSEAMEKALCRLGQIIAEMGNQGRQANPIRIASSVAMPHRSC